LNGGHQPEQLEFAHWSSQTDGSFNQSSQIRIDGHVSAALAILAVAFTHGNITEIGLLAAFRRDRRLRIAELGTMAEAIGILLPHLWAFLFFYFVVVHSDRHDPTAFDRYSKS
jgi:hypothetical protein